MSQLKCSLKELGYARWRDVNISQDEVPEWLARDFASVCR